MAVVRRHRHQTEGIGRPVGGGVRLDGGRRPAPVWNDVVQVPPAGHRGQRRQVVRLVGPSPTRPALRQAWGACSGASPRLDATNGVDGAAQGIRWFVQAQRSAPRCAGPCVVEHRFKFAGCVGQGFSHSLWRHRRRLHRTCGRGRDLVKSDIEELDRILDRSAAHREGTCGPSRWGDAIIVGPTERTTSDTSSFLARSSQTRKTVVGPPPTSMKWTDRRGTSTASHHRMWGCS
jgi:hypothetical protein